jgi:tetratricopeptide (TPR) repeat protein
VERVLEQVAQEQRQWPDAERYYQHALALKIEFGDRYGQASTYHQLGAGGAGTRQWAEQHYQQALALKIEFNERYAQAGTYHQLGRVAEEQRQWAEAELHYQQALAIYIEFNDEHNAAIVLRSFARLWRAAPELGIPGTVSQVLGQPVDEVERLLRRHLGE